MLGAALPIAAGLGIDPALVTCDVDNVGLRKVVERNGGHLWQASDAKLRFWVPTTEEVAGSTPVSPALTVTLRC
jgi:predicted acetyltransferase